jgi:hypothetical protein
LEVPGRRPPPSFSLTRNLRFSYIFQSHQARGAEKAGIVFKVTDNYMFYPPILLAKRNKKQRIQQEGMCGSRQPHTFYLILRNTGLLGRVSKNGHMEGERV